MYYAKMMEIPPSLPVMIDSGGFASLFANTKIIKKRNYGVLEQQTNEGITYITPPEVLDFQEQHADVAFTLDFIIPPGLKKKEAKKRFELTIMNAIWALQNRRRKNMPLYACLQFWDKASARECAKIYAKEDFDGIAIGGLVPRAKNTKEIFDIVDAVREEVPDKPIHAFGLGKPELVRQLFERGIQSVDSSSYVKQAASGRIWGDPKKVLTDLSPTERLHLALCNLASATKETLPLSTSGIVFKTHAISSFEQG
ncbi:tRNA-guanine transglycosylase [Thermodesulfobacteriota bacterium]